MSRHQFIVKNLGVFLAFLVLLQGPLVNSINNSPSKLRPARNQLASDQVGAATTDYSRHTISAMASRRLKDESPDTTSSNDEPKDDQDANSENKDEVNQENKEKSGKDNSENGNEAESSSSQKASSTSIPSGSASATKTKTPSARPANYEVEDPLLAQEDSTSTLLLDLSLSLTAQRVLAFFLAVLGMIFTAHQMSENPDGIYASLCRSILMAFRVVCRIVTCKACWSGLSGHHRHIPVCIDDYSYRVNDPNDIQ